jgi:hypothetical protein
MAKIENTTVYPNIIPTANDYVVLTDVNDNNATKTATVSQFQDYFGISTLEITLDKYEIMTLYSNPKVLLTCNAGEYILPISAIIKYIYKDMAYTFADKLEVRCGPDEDNAIFSWDAAALFNGINNVVAFPHPALAIPAPYYNNAAGGDSLTLGAINSNPTGDGGDIIINVQYRIVKF